VGIWGKAAFEFDATPGELAWVMASLGVAAIIGSAVAGALIDRFDPRRVLIVGEILFIPSTLAVLAAGSITEMIVLVFLIGLIGTPVFTAVASVGPFLTDDPEDLGRINGAIETSAMAAFIVGPGVGAVMARWVSLDSIFVLDAATSLVGALILLPVRLRPSTGRRESAGLLTDMVQGLRYAWNHLRLRFYIMLGASLWLVYGTFSALEPIFYREVLKTGPEAMGAVNTVFGLGLVGATLVVGRLPASWRGARGLVTLVALNGLGGLVYVGTSRIAVVVVGAALWGIVIGLLAPIHRTLIQLNTPDELMGRVTAASQSSGEMVKMLPLVMVAPLAARLGSQAVLLASAFLLTVLGGLTFRGAMRLDQSQNLPSPPPQRGAEEPRSSIP
jgi:MFS family permease